MKPKRLSKLKRELAAKSSKGSVSPREMEQLAVALGRRVVNRGKEPTWEQEVLSGRPPLAIPHHGSKDLSPGVKRIVISVLQGDIEAWESVLSIEDDEAEEEDDDE